MKRFAPSESPIALDHGVPLFLQQLVQTLRLEQTTPHVDTVETTPMPAHTEIGRAAAVHGGDLLRLGYSIDQVVHDYGDVCQSVTQLAGEQNQEISTNEFRTLNRCLDNAIADAVTAFGSAHQVLLMTRRKSCNNVCIIIRSIINVWSISPSSPFPPYGRAM